MPQSSVMHTRYSQVASRPCMVEWKSEELELKSEVGRARVEVGRTRVEVGRARVEVGREKRVTLLGHGNIEWSAHLIVVKPITDACLHSALHKFSKTACLSEGLLQQYRLLYLCSLHLG